MLVATEDEDALAKSFRNLERVAVVEPSELEVAAVVWARSLLVSRPRSRRQRSSAAAGEGEVAS